jgi:hypothetical protein
MKPSSLEKEIIERVRMLSYELQRKVLDYTEALTKKLPRGIPGKRLLKFAGSISPEDLQEMKHAIADHCEQVDMHEW